MMTKIQTSILTKKTNLICKMTILEKKMIEIHESYLEEGINSNINEQDPLDS
ncbi:hypothetical protein J2W48_003006 [Flavobacterium piscis]|uniref:Uncharacterized protein n=1 Tax=Flavobacterium piscis TaxID=1114874 RepID=A0ABU1Y9Y5_9FLAO|nr:hypothetical protein [Flavobacterium piscis]